MVCWPNAQKKIMHILSILDTKQQQWIGGQKMYPERNRDHSGKKSMPLKQWMELENIVLNDVLTT